MQLEVSPLSLESRPSASSRSLPLTDAALQLLTKVTLLKSLVYLVRIDFVKLGKIYLSTHNCSVVTVSG